MATGLAESEKALLEKMKKIEEVVNAKCSSSYRGSETERRQKEALFSCIGNEKMRQHFWQTATKNAGRPLTLLCRCLVESLTTLFNDVSSTLEFLEMYQTVSIGKELGDFADNFVDCRKDFFLEPTIGRQEDGISYEDVVKKITCNAMEEYKALLASGVKLPDLAPPKFCPKSPKNKNAWVEIFQSDAKLNEPRQYVFHMTLRRFWRNLDKLLKEFRFPEQDVEFLNAAVARPGNGSVLSRQIVLRQKVNKALYESFCWPNSFRLTSASWLIDALKGMPIMFLMACAQSLQ